MKPLCWSLLAALLSGACAQRVEQDAGIVDVLEGENEGLQVVEGELVPECGEGWTYEEREAACVDMDECAGPNACSSSATCTNTVGSYTCTCNAGYVGDGVRCLRNNTAVRVCRTGFVWFRARCKDVNECVLQQPCLGAQARCLNTIGSYLCVCSNGQAYGATGCADVETAASIRSLNTTTLPIPTTPVTSTITYTASPITTAAPTTTTTPSTTTTTTTQTTTTRTSTQPTTTTTPSKTTTSFKTTSTTTSTTPKPTAPPAPSTCTNVDSKGRRVRKEWREQTADEKKLYLDAFRELVKRNQLQGLIANHSLDSIMVFGHQTNAFLAWHRHFLVIVENTMRNLGPQFRCLTLPYWDWTLDVKPDPSQVPYITVVQDLGGTGATCILDTFIGKWRYKSKTTAAACVTRPFKSERGWRPPGPVEVAGEILNRKGFWEFSDMLKGWHSLVHNRAGGTMADVAFAPNDPLFFLHHSMVDKLWATWQQCHNTATVPITPGVTPPTAIYEQNVVEVPHGFDTPLHELTPASTLRQVNDIARLGYTYSADRMQSSSAWTGVLAKCPTKVAWYQPPRARRDAEEPARPTARQRALAVQEAADVSRVETTAVHVLATAQARLRGAKMVGVGTDLVVEAAVQLECSALGSYGVLDKETRMMLGIGNTRLPCEP